MPNYSVSVSCFLEVVSQLMATQLTDGRTVISDHRPINNDTQCSVVLIVHAHKMLLSRDPEEYDVMNTTAAQGSICKHKAQYKCYFTWAQIVVCHVCPNTVHVLCCLNQVKEQRKDFATKGNYLIIKCTVCCHNKVVSGKSLTKGKSSCLEGNKKKTDYSSSNDNPSKPERNSMNILISWLTAEGNYSQYKGGDGNQGETKITIAKELSLKMMHSGCVVERDPKQIANKISELV